MLRVTTSSLYGLSFKPYISSYSSSPSSRLHIFIIPSSICRARKNEGSLKRHTKETHCLLCGVFNEHMEAHDCLRQKSRKLQRRYFSCHCTIVIMSPPVSVQLFALISAIKRQKKLRPLKTSPSPSASPCSHL